MTNKITQFVSLFVVMLFLSGCSILDNIQDSPDSLSPEEVADIYNQEQLFLSISDSINNLEQIRAEINTTFQYDDKTISKTQENFEQYQEQTLSNYEIKSKSDTNDQSLNETFILKDGEYYHQVQNAPYTKTDQPTRQPFIYLNFLQFLLNEDIKWETVTEDNRIIEASTEITDPEITNALAPFLDLPVIVSPEAQYTFLVKYSFDPESGAIQQGIIEGTIEDLGNKFNIQHELISVHYNDEADSIGLDSNTLPMNVSDGFLSAFTEANPTSALTNYEMQRIRTDAEQVIDEMFITQNTLNTDPYIDLISSVNNEEIETFGVGYQSTYYEQQNEELNQQSWPTYNPYHHFTQRIKTQIDALEEIESEEGILSYREIFDNDLSVLNEAIGEANVDQFKENDQQIYGIDYHIDAETKRLLNVIIWNGEVTDASVNTTTAYAFGNLNPYTLNLLSSQLNPQILDAIQP